MFLIWCELGATHFFGLLVDIFALVLTLICPCDDVGEKKKSLTTGAGSILLIL